MDTAVGQPLFIIPAATSRTPSLTAIWGDTGIMNWGQSRLLQFVRCLKGYRPGNACRERKWTIL